MDRISLAVPDSEQPAGEVVLGGRDEPPPFRILQPVHQRIQIVAASPHSGAAYPDEFVASSRLDRLTLRKSEDSFIDEIFSEAPRLGAPLLCALFPRAFIDPNREPYELDPSMFEDELPEFVNRRSPRVAVGLGTIARVVGSGEDIYSRKLRFAEAERRIERFYRPYHAALAHLLEETRGAFGCYLLLDCHSMPSGSTGHTGQRGGDRDRRRIDIVLGDCHGTTCHPLVTETAEAVLRGQGYAVARNVPYAGGFVTASYGKPGTGCHGLQIEINRALYMDERTMERRPFLAQMRRDMAVLMERLGALDREHLAAQ